MATAKVKGKVSFKDRFAKPQTKVWRGKMYNGEEAEIEIRKVSGVDALVEIRLDVQDYTKRAHAVQAKVEEAEENGDAVDLEKADLAIIYEGNVLFGKMLKRVVVLPSDEPMSDEEWTEMASNMGGLESELWPEVAAAVGLGRVDVEKHDLPFTSAAKED